MGCGCGSNKSLTANKSTRINSNVRRGCLPDFIYDIATKTVTAKCCPCPRGLCTATPMPLTAPLTAQLPPLQWGVRGQANRLDVPCLIACPHERQTFQDVSYIVCGFQKYVFLFPCGGHYSKSFLSIVGSSRTYIDRDGPIQTTISYSSHRKDRKVAIASLLFIILSWYSLFLKFQSDDLFVYPLSLGTRDHDIRFIS